MEHYQAVGAAALGLKVITAPKRHLYWVFGVAFVLRGLCVFFAGAQPAVSLNMDSGSYIIPANNMRDHQTFAHGEWPHIGVETERTPGYSVFLMPFIKDTKLNVAATQWAHVLIGALTVCLLYWITLYFTRNTTAALLAALGLGIDSVVVLYTPIILTETVFLAMWTLSFWCVLRGATKSERSIPYLTAAGILLGLTSLVRPVSLYYFIFVLPFLALTLRRNIPVAWWKNVLVFVVAALVVPALWTIRNGKQSGVYTFSSIQAENLNIVRAVLLEMNRSGKSYPDAMAFLDDEFKKTLLEQPLTVYQRSAARGIWSMKFILSHPIDYADFLRKDFVKLMGGNSLKVAAWFFTRDPEYDPWKIPLYNPYTLPQQAVILFKGHPILGISMIFYTLFFLIVYLMSLAGFVFSWKQNGPATALLLASPAIYIILVTVGAASHARYRIPAMPCLYLLAAVAAQKWIVRPK